MRTAFLNVLDNLASNDPDVILITGDLGYSVFDDFELKYPNQYINAGVAEQNMIGIASGLALEGKKIFIYSIGNFPTLRCLEQIRNDACYHELNINIVASGGGFSYGGLGMSHHATEDISIMRSLPGVTLIVPSTAWEVTEATKALYKHKGVGYLRIDKSIVESYAEKKQNFSIGQANLLRKGSDITIFSSGGILNEALIASEVLLEKGIECRVLSLCSIKPIDVNAIRLACEQTNGIITIEENNLSGGLGSAIAEVCMDNNFRPRNFLRIGLKDEYSAIVGSQQFLKNYYNLDSEMVINSVMSLMK